MVPVWLLLATILVSGVWGLSEGLDEEVEIGEPMHFPAQHKKVAFVCPSLYGRFPHEKDCSMFYECRMGKLQLMKCNRDKLYDAKRQQCNDRRRVNCRDKNDHDHDHDKDKDKEKEKVIKSFKCPRPSGTFPHPDDCSKYFACFLNVPSMLQCYGSNLYDERSHKCLDKRRVKCGNRPDGDKLKKTTKIPTQRPTTRQRTTTTEKPTTQKDTHRYRCPFPRGRFSDPEDCSQYFDCHSGVAKVYKCPKNKLYDERKEECSQDKNVRCGDRPGGIGGDKDEKDKTVIRCPYQWGIFPHPEDCSKYLICIYTVPTVYTCGKDELYHAKYRRCYRKDKVTCDYRINPDDLRPRSTTKPGRTTSFVTTTTRDRLSTERTTVTKTTLETTITTEAETTPAPTTTVETTVITEAQTTPAPTTTEETTVVATEAETTPAPTTTEETTVTTEAETTPAPTTTEETTEVTTEAETTPAPTTTVETTITTEAETTPAPTTTEETTVTTEAETTPAPTTTEETTVVTTEAETTPAPTTTVETTVVTTEAETTTLATTIQTVAETTTEVTTPEASKPTTVPSSTPSVRTTPSTTPKVTKPNTPPPTECEDDDLDCIIDVTGDVKKWFDCPERFGHFAHGSSPQLFIHCDNWRPHVKICGEGTVFSPKYLVCMWLDRSG